MQAHDLAVCARMKEMVGYFHLTWTIANTTITHKMHGHGVRTISGTTKLRVLHAGPTSPMVTQSVRRRPCTSTPSARLHIRRTSQIIACTRRCATFLVRWHGLSSCGQGPFTNSLRIVCGCSGENDQEAARLKLVTQELHSNPCFKPLPLSMLSTSALFHSWSRRRHMVTCSWTAVIWLVVRRQSRPLHHRRAPSSWKCPIRIRVRFRPLTQSLTQACGWAVILFG
jgi:hypothetical protein